MTDLSKLFYVNVGPKGSFRPSGDSDIDTTPADVDAIIAHLREKKQRHVVLYFHGGLVNKHSGLKTAARVSSLISTDDAAPHTIAFVWETGAIETILQNIDTIYNTKLFRKLLEKIIKLAGEKLGIDANTIVGKRGVGSLSYTEINAELETEAPFDNYTVTAGKRSATAVKASTDEATLRVELEEELEIEFEADTELQATLQTEKSPEVLEVLDTQTLTDTKQEGERGIIEFVKAVKAAVEITLRVIKRHLKNRDHGFYPTIIEELLRQIMLADAGAWLWGAMKTKAADMWKPHEATASGNELQAGRYLLEQLQKYADEVGGITLDIVGHSAGSIVSCELVRAMSSGGPRIPIRQIAFLAPACRCDLFAETILQQQNLFQRFRIYTMNDETECKDRMIPLIYTRSLLYLISGALEKEGEGFDEYILGLQRHITGRSPYENEAVLNSIKAFLEAGDNRIVYSPTPDDAPPGLQTTSHRHGDFDNYDEKEKKTLDSVVYILKH